MDEALRRQLLMAQQDQRISEAINREHARLHKFIRSRVTDQGDAEDILQEAFARGLDRLPEFESEESAVAWFYRVLRNAVIDHHRRSGASERALSVFTRELETNDEPDLDMRNAACRCVGLLAETLKPEYAAALRRVEVEGVPVQEFAREAGITASNAGVRLFRAREALRKRVAQSCGTCAEHGCLDCTCRTPGGRAPES